MFFEYKLSTSRNDLYNITQQIHEAIVKSGVTSGIAVVFCSHTTAGITINENADPDVVHDLLLGLEKAFPGRADFRHSEGNNAAHLKASAVGLSATVIIDASKSESISGASAFTRDSNRVLFPAYNLDGR